MPTPRDAELWKTISELFDAAVDLPLHERDEFLKNRCGGDPELYSELEALLRNESGAAQSVEQILTGAAASLAEVDYSGKRLGSYRILGILAHGGMGSVYLAERDDEAFEKKVAIKLIRGLAPEALLERFRDERRILAGLEHPYIARLIDGGTSDDGVPFLVMEYVEGVSLREYCEQSSLNPRQRCELFLKLCEAVSCAHHNLVVHRDLKPGNILVTPQGDPKLLDFGIARLLDAERAGDSTLGFWPQLTPEYASPEQIRGLRVTTASDIYSLGVLLYELLTGERLHQFANLSRAEIERAVCDQPFSKALAAQLEGDLGDIVAMALRLEPGRRYGSVEMLSEDLRRHLAGMPVMAHEDTVAYRLSRFVRRNRWKVVAFAAGSLLLASSAAIALWQGNQARIQRDAAERRLNKMVQLADGLVFDVNGALERTPGATDSRQQVLRITLDYLDGLVRESGGAPRVIRSVAAAYVRLGDLQGSNTRPGLTRSAEAAVSYDRAIALLAPLVNASPSDADLHVEWAGALRRKAAILEVRGQARESVDVYRKALAALDPFEPSGKDSVLQELADLNHGMAESLTVVDTSKLRPYVERKLALYQKLAARHPDSPDILNGLASSYISIASTLMLAHDPRSAVEFSRKAVETRERLVALKPGDALIRRDLMMSYARMGDYSGNPWVFTLGDWSAGVSWFRKCVDLARQAVQADPKNRTAHRDLATAQVRIGSALVMEGQYREAIETLESAVREWNTLLAEDSGNASFRDQLGTAYEYIGAAYEHIGTPDDEIRSYRKSLAAVETIGNGHPTDSPTIIQLIQSNGLMAVALARSGNGAEAMVAAKKSLSIAADAAEHGPNAPRFKSYLAKATFWLARVEAHAGRRKQARDAWRRSLELWRDAPPQQGDFSRPNPADATAALTQLDSSDGTRKF